MPVRPPAPLAGDQSPIRRPAPLAGGQNQSALALRGDAPRPSDDAAASWTSPWWNRKQPAEQSPWWRRSDLTSPSVCVQSDDNTGIHSPESAVALSDVSAHTLQASASWPAAAEDERVASMAARREARKQQKLRDEAARREVARAEREKSWARQQARERHEEERRDRANTLNAIFLQQVTSWTRQPARGSPQVSTRRRITPRTDSQSQRRPGTRQLTVADIAAGMY